MVTWSTVSSTSPASLESKLAPRFIYVGQKVDKGDRKQEVGPKSSDMQRRKRKMKVFIFLFCQFTEQTWIIIAFVFDSL